MVKKVPLVPRARAGWSWRILLAAQGSSQWQQAGAVRTSEKASKPRDEERCSFGVFEGKIGGGLGEQHVVSSAFDSGDGEIVRHNRMTVAGIEGDVRENIVFLILGLKFGDGRGQFRFRFFAGISLGKKGATPRFDAGFPGAAGRIEGRLGFKKRCGVEGENDKAWKGDFTDVQPPGVQGVRELAAKLFFQRFESIGHALWRRAKRAAERLYIAAGAAHGFHGDGAGVIPDFTSQYIFAQCVEFCPDSFVLAELVALEIRHLLRLT